MKPRLRLIRAHGPLPAEWICMGDGAFGIGATPAAAYVIWASRTRPVAPYNAPMLWQPRQPIPWWAPGGSPSCGNPTPPWRIYGTTELQ